MEWGTVGGRGKGMGRERRGGGQFTNNQVPEWTGNSPLVKEGFQVSKRDSGTGRVHQAKGDCQEVLTRGFIEGFVPCALI